MGGDGDSIADSDERRSIGRNWQLVKKQSLFSLEIQGQNRREKQKGTIMLFSHSEKKERVVIEIDWSNFTTFLHSLEGTGQQVSCSL